MKKLIRGLKDVSPFFASQVKDSISLPAQDLAPSSERVAPPANAVVAIPELRETENVTSCFTIFSEESFQTLLTNQPFLSKLRETYNELYVLRSMSQAIKQKTDFAANHLCELTLTSFQVDDLLQLEPVAWSEKDRLKEKESKCFFLAPNLILQHRHLFQMIDRAILYVSAASAESIARAYQTLTACLHENPQTRFSLFVADTTSDEMLEMVCERFAGITSRFLGCEVDFLGFANQDEVEINTDILCGIRTLDDAMKDPLKARLRQLFQHYSELQTQHE